jgi:hypothetical protein
MAPRDSPGRPLPRRGSRAARSSFASTSQIPAQLARGRICIAERAEFRHVALVTESDDDRTGIRNHDDDRDRE